MEKLNVIFLKNRITGIIVDKMAGKKSSDSWNVSPQDYIAKRPIEFAITAESRSIGQSSLTVCAVRSLNSAGEQQCDRVQKQRVLR